MGLGAGDGGGVVNAVTSGHRAALAIAAYLVGAAFLVWMGPYAEVSVRGGRLAPPESRPGVSTAAVSIFLGRLGDDGRAQYARALALDFAIPILYVAAGWAIVSWVRERRPSPSWAPSMAVRLLILVAAAEVIENLLLYSALSAYPYEPPMGSLIGPVVTTKFVLVALSVVSLVAISVWCAISLRVRRTADVP